MNHIQNLFQTKEKQLPWVYLGAVAFTTPPTAFAYFDVSNGVEGTISGAFDSSGMEKIGDWWRCWVAFTTDAADTSGQLRIGVSDGDGNRSTTPLDGTSDIYLWQADFVAASTVSSPIPTTTGSVTRDATEFLVTPDTEEYLRFRLGSVNAENYLTSGTISCDYDGSSSFTFTDGTNTMTASGARAIGDTVVIQESTGKMWVNENLEDTNGSYSPTWGEISLGNITDITFSADIDPTDSSWKEPV